MRLLRWSACLPTTRWACCPQTQTASLGARQRWGGGGDWGCGYAAVLGGGVHGWVVHAARRTEQSWSGGWQPLRGHQLKCVQQAVLNRSRSLMFGVRL